MWTVLIERPIGDYRNIIVGYAEVDEEKQSEEGATEVAEYFASAVLRGEIKTFKFFDTVNKRMVFCNFTLMPEVYFSARFVKDYKAD